MNPGTRIYVDTSVFGGVHDEEFASPSKVFFEEVRAGYFTVLVSPVTFGELADAPEKVRQVYENLPATSVEEVPIGEGVHSLAKTYIERGVLSGRWLDDASTSRRRLSPKPNSL